jgi:dGTPase
MSETFKAQWDKLLSKDRFRDTKISETDGRSPFENDYARVVFSSPFRRLQDKTQVFPLEKGDFVRTRLTHSIEVSTLARSIGASAEKLLEEKGYLREDKRTFIPSILATAALLHDIGNPPFGHYGEDVIKKFFSDLFEKNQYGLSAQEQSDLKNFDGNVQAFRLARYLQYLGKDEGYNLTRTVLATIIKYPCSSLEGNKKEKGRTDIPASLEKFGYFVSEEDDYAIINDRLGLNKHRHPLVFLLEAADDIAFSAADIEDGCKKKIIDDRIIRKYLELMPDDDPNKNIFLTELDKCLSDISADYPNRMDIAMQNFRIKLQGEMILQAIETFIDRQVDILNGSFDEDLLMASKARNIRIALKDIASKELITSTPVIETELVGESVLLRLLDELTRAFIIDPIAKRSQRIRSIVSSNYTFLYEHKGGKGSENYRKFQLIVDHICGMTDTYALSEYKKLLGVEL